MTENDRTKWVVTDKTQETPDVWTLSLEPVEERPVFRAGQYVTIMLAGHEPAEGKAYSISSAPADEEVTITVKKMGAFSSAIVNLEQGSEVETSAPYGFFYPEEEDEELVFITGGIGVTPIGSILRQMQHEQDARTRRLFYANHTADDVVFRDRFFTMEKEVSEFSFMPHLTRTGEIPSGHYKGRFSAADILAPLTDPARASFFICGSIGFNQGVWNSLKEAGVVPEQIYTEGFF
jgi:ferredoxin-NADP reductase